MGRQRFCCRACSDAWFMTERRQAVQAFRQQQGEAEAEKEHAA